ncbi:MAG TPA: hypothetical protein V6C99_09870 [Oculatellaceae cyanobacterium]|jgi:hypothetical protein
MQNISFGQVPASYGQFGASPAGQSKAPRAPQFGLADGGVCSVPCCATACALPLLIVAVPLLLLKFGGKNLKTLFSNLGSKLFPKKQPWTPPTPPMAPPTAKPSASPTYY